MLKSKIEYDYIWLLSGQDYPIARNEKIQDYLKESSTSAFIDIAKNNLNSFCKRNEIYYPKCMMGKNLLSRISKLLWIYLSGGRSHTFQIFKRKNIVGEWYFGSQWWCLPYGCIQEINSLIESNPQKMKYFQHSICCDECFFQTMVMQTSYAERVRDYLTYVDWSEKQSSPKILTTRDYEALKLSDKFFARKFDLTVDAMVLDKIDEYMGIEKEG